MRIPFARLTPPLLLLLLLLPAPPSAADTKTEALAAAAVVKSAPYKGVHKAKKVEPLDGNDQKLMKTYAPALSVFTAKHRTRFHEYLNVESLIVVREDKAHHVVEYLFSHEGWPELLSQFVGAKATSPDDTEQLTQTLISILGPRIDGHSFKSLAPVDPMPLPDGWEARVAQSGSFATWLVFTFDKQHTLTDLQIERRQVEKKTQGQKRKTRK